MARKLAPAHLTPRQHDALHGLVAELTYELIAEHLALSLATVSTYVREIHAVLGVHKAAAAVHTATRMGLLHGRRGSRRKPALR